MVVNFSASINTKMYLGDEMMRKDLFSSRYIKFLQEKCFNGTSDKIFLRNCYSANNVWLFHHIKEETSGFRSVLYFV